MTNKSGFDRLKGLASAGAFSFGGLLGGMSARAASVPTGLSIIRSTQSWQNIGNSTFFSTLTSSNGGVINSNQQAYCIADAVVGTQLTITSTLPPLAYNDAFDNTLALSVDGEFFINPDTTIDLTDDVVTSDTMENIIDGIDTNIQYRFYQPRQLVRALFQLTNTTQSSIDLSALVFGQFGSTDETVVKTSSNGDQVIEVNDMWYITSDDRDAMFAPDPFVTTSRYGIGASVVPLNGFNPAVDDGFYGLRYELTVPPQESVYIMIFQELGYPTTEALPEQIRKAKDFTSLSRLDAANLISDLNAEIRSKIVNYGVSTDVIFDNGFE